MSKNKKNYWLCATLATCSAVSVIPAYGEIEEIVVTARKREESILKVPVAATALSGEQLAQFGTNDLYSATERVPGFVMGTQVGSIGPTPSLRGIGTGTLNPTIDQSVSLNIDGLGFSQAMAYSSGLFDMKQIEVLRGPQSLYFGKNSTAGVIAIHTRDPGDEFEIELVTGYEGEANETVGEFVISGPVTETLGLRLAAKYSDMDGYIDNKAVGDGITGITPKNDTVPVKEDIYLRGTAVWEPTERLSAKLKLNYASSESEGSSDAEMTSCPDGKVAPELTSPPLDPAIVGGIAFLYGTTNPQFLNLNDNCELDGTLYVVDANPESLLYTGIRNNGTPFSDLEQFYTTLDISYELSNELTLDSVTGYYEADHSVMINGGQTGFAGPLIIADTDFERQDFTQELRLTSNLEGAFNYMLGLYYQDAEMANRTGLFFLGPRDRGYLPIDIESEAIFGQLLWQVSPEVEISVGARYNKEDREFNPYNYDTGEAFDIALYGTDSLSAENLSPEVAVTYSPTDNMTWFISYRKAFKSGSWDTVSNPRGIDLSFDDEEVQGFEGGLKTYLLDNTLALNLSAYSYEYDNMQVGANESTDEGFLIRTLNAATADVRGIDFDVTYEPVAVEGLQLFLVANYNDAEFGKFDNAQCWSGQTFSQGCTEDFDDATGLYVSQDLSGGELLRSPEYSATFGFTYEASIANSNMKWSIGTSTQYSDSFVTDVLQRDDFYQDSFTKTSLNLSLSDSEGAWQISLIAKNLEDEITAGNCTNFNGLLGNIPGTVITGSPTDQRGIAGVAEHSCIPERGREVWLRLTLRPMLF